MFCGFYFKDNDLINVCHWKRFSLIKADCVKSEDVSRQKLLSDLAQTMSIKTDPGSDPVTFCSHSLIHPFLKQNFHRSIELWGTQSEVNLKVNMKTDFHYSYTHKEHRNHLRQCFPTRGAGPMGVRGHWSVCVYFSFFMSESHSAFALDVTVTMRAFALGLTDLPQWINHLWIQQIKLVQFWKFWSCGRSPFWFQWHNKNLSFISYFYGVWFEIVSQKRLRFTHGSVFYTDPWRAPHFVWLSMLLFVNKT